MMCAERARLHAEDDLIYSSQVEDDLKAHIGIAHTKCLLANARPDPDLR